MHYLAKGQGENAAIDVTEIVTGGRRGMIETEGMIEESRKEITEIPLRIAIM